MTSTYIVLLHSDEQRVVTATAADLAAMHAAHVEFARATLTAGHRIVGGEHLTPAGSAIVVRRDGETFETSEGPYTETTEQIAGYYAVETDDPAGVAELAAPLAWHDGAAVELRPVVDHSADADLGVRAHAAAAS
jgi:hypothetical protein